MTSEVRSCTAPRSLDGDLGCSPVPTTPANLCGACWWPSCAWRHPRRQRRTPRPSSRRIWTRCSTTSRQDGACFGISELSLGELVSSVSDLAEPALTYETVPLQVLPRAPARLLPAPL